MGCPEIKVLRDALAREIALREKSEARVADLERLLGERDGTMAEKDVIIFEQAAIISDLQRRMGAYENPHTPPSHGSIPERKEGGAEKGPVGVQEPRAQKGPQGGIAPQQGHKDRAPHPQKVPQLRLQEDQDDGQEYNEGHLGHSGGAEGRARRKRH